MNKREQEILSYLTKNNGWVSAKKISNSIGISTRSIRKYISTLNKRNIDPIVLSSNKGYKLDYKNYKESLNKKSKNFNLTPSERRKLLICELLIHGNINFLNFLNKLFISEATFNNDLISVKSVFKRYHLTVNQHKDFLFLKGSEINKRTMLSELVEQKNWANFGPDSQLNTNAFANSEISIRKLSNIIERILVEEDIYINDYTLQFIVIHIYIMITRIKSKNIIKSKNYSSNHIPQIVKLIGEKLQEEYKIKISQIELKYLDNIIQNNLPLKEKSNNQDCRQLVINILIKVEQIYALNLINDDFINKFSFHIENLYERTIDNIHIKSPLEDDINENYPLIYDVSIYIASQLEKVWEKNIDSTEIDYIAFHIGSFLAMSQQNNFKIKCLIYYKEYYDVKNRLKYKLNNLFSDSLIISDIRRLDSNQPISTDIDLIITTSKDFTLYQSTSIPIFIISPILSYKNINGLRAMISSIKETKEAAMLKSFLLELLKPELFKKNLYFNNEIEAITYLCNETEKLGYSNQDFKKSVLERERSSSTAFFNELAIPHALNCEAKKSFFSIVINDHKMSWGDKKINIICLFGINSASEKKGFRMFFEKIINIFSDIENIKKMKSTKNYIDFINLLKNLLQYN